MYRNYLHMYMKKLVLIIAILSVATGVATAQTFTPTKIDNPMIQSQQIMQPGAAYEGTVYEPFSNTTPSEQSEVGASYSPSSKPGPRRSLIGGPEDELGPSPLGDGVLPLLLCAAVFCGVIALRRKRSAE